MLLEASQLFKQWRVTIFKQSSENQRLFEGRDEEMLLGAPSLLPHLGSNLHVWTAQLASNCLGN